MILWFGCVGDCVGGYYLDLLLLLVGWGLFILVNNVGVVCICGLLFGLLGMIVVMLVIVYLMLW